MSLKQSVASSRRTHRRLRNACALLAALGIIGTGAVLGNHAHHSDAARSTVSHVGDAAYAPSDPSAIPTPTADTSAGPATGQGTGSVYVAMGDSFSSGEGAGNYDPNTAQGEGKNDCHRSSDSYPVQFAQKYADVPAEYRTSMTFLACSGATTAAIATPLPSPHADATEQATPQEPVQSTSDALGPNTKLVTLTAGGNDLGFADVLTNCWKNQARPDLSKEGFQPLPSTVTGCAAKWHDVVDTRLARLQPVLAAAYKDIRDKAPNAHLVVLTYPQLFAEQPNADCQERNNMNDDDIHWIRTETDKFDEMITQTATAAGGTVLDTRPLFLGHEQCTSTSWFNGVIADGGPLGNTHGRFHPTATGYQQEASFLDSQLHALQLI